MKEENMLSSSDDLLLMNMTETENSSQFMPNNPGNITFRYVCEHLQAGKINKK
jgi:hypothetical protein